MAKVLEALERAKQERQKKLDDERNATAATDSLNAIAGDATYEDESQPETAPSAPVSRTHTVRREPVVHTQISEQVISAHDTQSPITEQLRQIRTNLETVLAEYRSRSLVITSPVSGDGKTLVTANLATVLADNPEHQVLLVDADLRKSDLYRLFGIRQTPGLSEYLREKASLESVIHETSLPNLKLIPAGHPPSKPTVLLSSDRMLNLIAELQRQYNWIIFDTPPLLPVTDASVLARECVGLVLVVRMGQTHRKTVERAQDLLAEMRLPVLGCILNDFVDTAPENQYYYKYYHKVRHEDGFRHR
jgi:capsular exopolysaccharide synthesis family protein